MKTILITGANSGIGYETAKALALKGNLIIVASRMRDDTAEIVQALNDLCQNEGSAGRVAHFHLDLSELDSVRQFAEKIKTEFAEINTLICNAGVMNSPYHITKDGYELQFQTNFLSHFYLTHLLIDKIMQSRQPKVINVCSASAEKGVIHSLNGLQAISTVDETDYDSMISYRESKLAQEISVLEFARRQAFQRVKFSLVHPGVVNTPLFYRNQGKWYKMVMTPFVYMGYAVGFFKTPRQGAMTSILLAENEEYPNGLYWTGEKVNEPNPISQDVAYAGAVWDWSIEQLNLGSH